MLQPTQFSPQDVNSAIRSQIRNEKISKEREWEQRKRMLEERMVVDMQAAATKKLTEEAYKRKLNCEEDACVEIVKETPLGSKDSNIRSKKTHWEELYESEDESTEERVKEQERQHETQDTDTFFQTLIKSVGMMNRS